MAEETAPGTGRQGEGERRKLAVALIADDLSGALDSTAPFAAAGFSCAVAVSAEDLEQALAGDAAVVAVNTASRHLSATEAVRIVGQVAQRLRAMAPEVVFKKVDSRLKGPVGVETQAVMFATGRARSLLAPAVPELGRWVKDGCVIGRGVAEPIAIRDRFDGLEIEVPDVADADALTAVARRASASAGETLFVGARSLAVSLARIMGEGTSADFPFHGPAVIVVGSRDPITLAQVEHLRRAVPALRVVEAPGGQVKPQTGVSANGHVGRGGSAGVTLFQAVPGPPGEREDVVAERFGTGIAAAISGSGVRTLVATGGDTAFALMRALGMKVVHPRGEVLPGMPWSRIAVPGHGDISLVTKSGGFGASDALVSILRLEAADARH